MQQHNAAMARLGRMFAGIVVSVALLAVPATNAAGVADRSGSAPAGAKAKVAAANRSLVASINAHAYKKARKYASAKVVGVLKGHTWKVDNCYRTPERPNDEVEYAGSMPWACNLMAYGGYVALGYRAADGRWQARDYQWLAD